MRLTEQIDHDLKLAMKAKDQVRLRALRAIKSAILLFNTDGSGRKLTSDLEIQLLQKMVKQRRESLEIYEKQDRPDLAKMESDEINVIQPYLPDQLSDEALYESLRAIITDVDAKTIKDMGKVMGAANRKLAGKAEGKRIAAIVRDILAV